MTGWPPFILLLFLFSAPFWGLGTIGAELLPGLPLSGLMAICPTLAALVLVHREGSCPAVAALLQRAADYRRIRPKIWFAPALLMMPAAAVLAYLAMRLMEVPLPAVQIPLGLAPVLMLGFFGAALGEELGWSGYLLDRLEPRWKPQQASILIGAVWAAWHVIPLVQAQRPPGWIAWWILATLFTRVLLVWLYYGAGRSVFAVALCHATQNVSWQLFPNRGSHYDPRFSALGLGLLAALVVVGWRRRQRNACDRRRLLHIVGPCDPAGLVRPGD